MSLKASHLLLMAPSAKDPQIPATINVVETTKPQTGSRYPRVNIKRLRRSVIERMNTSKMTPTANQYELLSSDNEDDEKRTEGRRKRPKKTLTTAPPPAKPQLPPPIIITDQEFQLTKEVMSTLSISEYTSKNISIGQKVVLSNAKDHKTLLEYLKNCNRDCFTHRSNEEKLFKVVLSGLPKLNTDDLRNELLVLNIKPVNVYEMTTRSANQHRALYLLHLRQMNTL